MRWCDSRAGPGGYRRSRSEVGPVPLVDAGVAGTPICWRALTVSEVAVRFGGVSALNAVSLSVPPGMVTGLIGPNGAGKTTLFNVISGLQSPDRGSVHLFDTDVTTMKTHHRARLGLARTFQRLELFGTLTAGENVQVGLDSTVSGGGSGAACAGWCRRSAGGGNRWGPADGDVTVTLRISVPWIRPPATACSRASGSAGRGEQNAAVHAHRAGPDGRAGPGPRHGPEDPPARRAGLGPGRRRVPGPR